MTNVVETIKKQIDETVKNSISKAVQNGELPEFTVDELFIEIPKEKGHGDFSTNIATQTGGGNNYKEYGHQQYIY